MKNLSKKGFTLIELLIVIAIIGILATMGLVAFQNSRKKGMDTKVRNALNQIKTQAEVFYDDNQSYLNLDANADVVKMTTEITNAGVAAADTDVVVSATGDAYVAYSRLVSNTNYMCVDSTGAAKTGAAAPAAGATVCP